MDLSEKNMFRGIALIGLSLALSGAAFGQDQPVAPISVDQAVATAVSNSPTLASARLRVEKSRYQVDEAKGRSRFTVNGTGQFTHTTPVATFNSPGISLPGADSITASGTIAQPIDINGGLRLLRQVAGLSLDIQEYSEAQSLQQLISDTKNAYYNVLRAQANVDVAQSSIDSAMERLRVAKAQFDAGTAAKFDVTQAQVDVENRRQTLVQAQSGVDLAKAALNQVMGVTVDQPVAVEAQTVSVEPVTVDIPAETSRALVARPEIMAAKTGIDLSQHNVKLTATQDKPSLGVFATANWTDNTSSFSPNATTYILGANVSWPIWTGGVTKAQVAQARTDVSIAGKTLDQAKLGVELDVSNSALTLMEASKRVGTAKSNVDLAQEALRLAGVRYQEGVSTQVEVSNAETTLTQAQSNYVSAQYDFLSAKAQLERATASQPEYKSLTTAGSAPSAADVSKGANK